MYIICFCGLLRVALLQSVADPHTLSTSYCIREGQRMDQMQCEIGPVLHFGHETGRLAALVYECPLFLFL